MNWLLLKNSLLVSGLATLLALGFGFVASLALAGMGRLARGIFLAVAVIGLAQPPFLAANCWLDLLGPTGAWRNWIPVNIMSLGGAVWILALLFWPVTLLAVLSAWQRLEPALLENDPALRGWQLLRRLLLPLARQAAGLAAVLTFVLALNNFAVPAILQVKVFPAEVWVKFNTTFDTPGALMMSWPLVLAPLLLLAWTARREFSWPRLQATVVPRLFRRQLGMGWFWMCAVAMMGICAASVAVPLGQLIFATRTWTELGGALAAGHGAVENSAWYAGAAATVILVMGLVFASRTRGWRFGRKAVPQGWDNAAPSFRMPLGFRLLEPRYLGCYVLWLAFLVPGVILGIGLIAAFNHDWSAPLYQSAGIVVLAFVIRYLAIGWTGISAAFAGTDRNLTDAARIEGASRWQMLRRVQWPQIAPQAAAVWYIVFLLCLWDVETIILVVPPGGETLALRAFNLLHYGHNAQVNALCLLLLLLAVAPLIVWGLSRAVTARLAGRVRYALPLGLALFVLSGCSPSGNRNQASLDSRLFSRAEVIGHRGAGVGEFNKPRSVTVDTQDNIYAVDMTGRVQKFSPGGEFLLSWQMPQTELGKPKGMSRDRQGNIIVVEPHYQRVNHFSTDGKLLTQWGQRGTNAGQFMLPRGVAINSKGEFLVSEYAENERVQRFVVNRGPGTKATFELIGSIGRPGNADGEFNRPEGLCVDAQDRIYVADSCNHRIQVFDAAGKFLRAYGKPGSGKGELSYPYDICVDAAGRQYVCEFGNSRIQVFDANDQPIEIIGGPGPKPGQFSNPWGITLDSKGNLIVADALNNRVQKLLRSENVAEIDQGARSPAVRTVQWEANPPHPGPLPKGEGERWDDLSKYSHPLGSSPRSVSGKNETRYLVSYKGGGGQL